MFRSLSLASWLGGDGRPAYSRAQEEEDEEDEDREEEEEDEPSQVQARGLGNYLFTVATSASKRVAESVRVTTQSIKKSHPIDRILDKTILGDFKKEQDKFVREKKSKKADRTEAPWVGYCEEELMKQQILALSSDRRNLLRDPPSGVHFSFDFEKTTPVAMVMLREDPALNRMRYELVPKNIKEEDFWRNYFYRVSLIKQSAQLASMQAEGSICSPEDRLEDLDNAGSFSSRTTPIAIESRDSAMEEDSASPPVSEFVSDAYILSSLSSEDISQGMEQLGMGRLDDAALSDDEDLPEWEKELQRELQEFGSVEDGGKVNEAWEKEIEDMLQEKH
ncbi:synapse-associated protein 1-like [Ambystoma mexicanum]|uniref:synapse-associated protein 1-like n=1 Tax=Ambystoma mexicanum TaxID=8296 RepID=UPI0037E85D6C